MSEPNVPSPATRAAHIAAFGLLYALAALVARTLLARPLTLTPELQSLAALGLIETRPLQLYQVAWAKRTEEP